MQIFGKDCSLSSVDQLLSSLDKLDHIQWLVHYPLFFFLLIQFSPLVMLTLVCTNCRLRRASFIVTIVGSAGLWASLTDGLPSLCLVSFIIILTYNIGYRIGGHENYFHCKRCGMHFFMIKLLPRTNCKFLIIYDKREVLGCLFFIQLMKQCLRMLIAFWWIMIYGCSMWFLFHCLLLFLFFWCYSLRIV